MISNTLDTDFLIIGSGAAGLKAALQASQYGRVRLVTKSDLKVSSSYWAQGGIAAVLNGEDNFSSHIEDTLAAGRSFCDTEAVEILVKEGARQVQQLIEQGMPFDKKDGAFDLGLEGGHSKRRVLHANGAATGKALIEFLTALVKAEQNITITERAFVYQLLVGNGVCNGASAYLYDKNQHVHIQSPVTVLATGGYSGLYQRSTNPHTSTGDGLWLAYEAGAVLEDLEFVQFHPTAFYAPDSSTFLISEAVRGEGAYLYNTKGERFMEKYDQKELAPRDVVSSEIWGQIHQQNTNYVYLDVSHLDFKKIKRHFPGIFKKIKEHGIDIKKEGIPVAPAAHYCIGGIATDLHARTSMNGLYACGEVAATGVHGANRLASNSLLECLVFGKRAIEHAVACDPQMKSTQGTINSLYINTESEKEFILLQQKIASTLSRYVGIKRDETGLQKALEILNTLGKHHSSEQKEYYSLRSRGLLEVAELITGSALERKESRGVHIRSDFPNISSDFGHISHQNGNEHTVML